MRGLTSLIVQTHQILRLPRKMNLMIHHHHTWNAIYNARSNKCHCPNSPNTAPATKNESHDWSLSHMKRYLQCVSLSKLTEYCACHAKWQISRKQLKCHFQCATDPTMIRDRSETDPTMIRDRSDHDPTMKPSSATRLATEVTFHAHHGHFVLKNTTFRAPAIIPNFTEYCACHEKWHLNFTKYCACHEKWHLNFTKYCACHELWLSYDLTELWLDQLWLDRAITWLSYDLTELWLDWAMTWLSYYLTELWLDWAITWLSYDLTELLSCDLIRISEVSQLNFLW